MPNQNTKQGISSTHIAFIAMFATLAGVLYILDFALPFAFPGFLEFKLSDIPILIGSFTLGPVSGAVIVVVEILIKLVIKGSSTVFVGELSDLVTSCVFAVTAGIIYKKHRTFKGALVGMAIGTAAEVIIAMLFNWLVLVPFYVQVFFGGSWTPLIGMMKPLFPACTESTFYSFYLWASVLPFNLLRCLVAIGVTLLVYKRISRLINSVNRKIYGKPDYDEKKSKKTTIILVCAGVAIVALLVTFALLRYFVF
ncbi:MAG: ECF transporter S component [Clostridiales bacterium]|nr:ECF transporter S component [Clostridiales bacterium]